MIFKHPIFIILLIAIWSTPYLSLGDFGGPIIMVLVAYCMPFGQNKFMKRGEAQMICNIFVATAIFSFFFFLSGHIQFKYLSRGISFSMFRIIEIYFCYKLLNYYGSKALTYCFYGLVFSYSINIVLALSVYGVSGLLSSMLSIFAMGVQNAGAESDEILESSHSTLLIMPFLSVAFFYAYLRKKQKQYLNWFIISTIISLLAYKRIAIAAAVVIFVLFFFKKLYNRITLSFVSFTSIAIGLGYIFLISSNLIYILVYQYDIDLMFRDRIWKSLDDVYIFGIDYIGNGWGFTTKYLHENSEQLLNGIFIGGIHNDLLKVYIDLGFWGFILYFGYFLFYIPLKFYKSGRLSISFLFFICQLYLFMIYFTDNAQTYFACQTIAYLLPFAMKID